MTRGTAVVRNASKTFVFDCLRCSLLCCQVFISLAYQTGQISSSKSLNAVRASIRVPSQQIITLFSPWSCWTMPEELFETVCVQSQFAGLSPWIANAFWSFGLPVHLPKTRWIADLDPICFSIGLCPIEVQRVLSWECVTLWITN